MQYQFSVGYDLFMLISSLRQGTDELQNPKIRMQKPFVSVTETALQQK